MNKRVIEIDFDVIAEEVAEAFAQKAGFDEKEKELLRLSNLEVLETLSSEDVQRDLIEHYVEKSAKLLDGLSEIINILGVGFKNE